MFLKTALGGLFCLGWALCAHPDGYLMCLTTAHYFRADRSKVGFGMMTLCRPDPPEAMSSHVCFLRSFLFDFVRGTVLLFLDRQTGRPWRTLVPDLPVRIVWLFYRRRNLLFLILVRIHSTYDPLRGCCVPFINLPPKLKTVKWRRGNADV